MTKRDYFEEYVTLSLSSVGNLPLHLRGIALEFQKKLTKLPAFKKITERAREMVPEEEARFIVENWEAVRLYLKHQQTFFRFFSDILLDGLQPDILTEEEAEEMFEALAEFGEKMGLEEEG